eukprot:TRINITY_DN29907_c0_g1_i1.p1 TRINITY_DN29907_c0_g1~~TRINITY_DN29907_c0_g1_i1.p1  ORF type:complete len:677 (-),score=67.38 TRINITY_DN29907_c0_g1_i1:456-2486(-)
MAASAVSRNPFSRRKDRIAFPAMSPGMWQCSPNDSFETPGSTSSWPVKENIVVASSSWTPGSQASFSWLSPSNMSCVDSGDAYFAEQERKGIVTPGRSPSDILRRGSLYDPNQTGTSSSSCCSATPTVPGRLSIFTPGSSGSSSSPGKTAQVPQACSQTSQEKGPQRPDEMSEQRKCSDAPADAGGDLEKAGETSGGETGGTGGGSRGLAAGAELEGQTSTAGRASTCQGVAGAAVADAADCTRGSSQAAREEQVSMRELDASSVSLSTSSISFGRDDVRMSGGLDREAGGGCAKVAAQQTVRPSSQGENQHGKNVAGGTSVAAARPATQQGSGSGGTLKCVVRQLDFGCSAESPRQATAQQRDSNSNFAQARCTDRIQSAVLPPRPVQDACTSPARGSSVLLPSPGSFEWDSSLSREVVVKGKQTRDSFILFSPLQTPSLQDRSRSAAVPCANSHVHPAQQQQLLAELHRLPAFMGTMQTPRGSTVLQLRLCSCGQGLQCSQPAPSGGNQAPQAASAVTDQSRAAHGRGCDNREKRRGSRSRRSRSAPHLASDRESGSRRRRRSRPKQSDYPCYELSEAVHRDNVRLARTLEGLHRPQRHGVSLYDIRNTLGTLRARYLDHVLVYRPRCSVDVGRGLHSSSSLSPQFRSQSMAPTYGRHSDYHYATDRSYSGMML